jgi:hypothetical protein
VDEYDYQSVLEYLQSEFNREGLTDLADPRNYTVVRDGRTEIAPPRIRLVEMLRAFERFLAMRDRHTYHLALGRMMQGVHGPRPDQVLVRPALDGESVDLSRAPDFGPIRVEIRILLDELTPS